MDIRNQFPVFKNQPTLAYLDNAATTQKPQVVIDALVDFYVNHNANVHRGLYPLSEQATEMYEAARKTIAKFINAEPEEIIFVSGTTDGLNAIAKMLHEYLTRQRHGAALQILTPSSQILVSELEHHANILPWQQIPGAKLSYIPVNNNFELNLSPIPGPDPDIVAVTQMSNVTGTIVDVKRIRQMFPSSILVVDAAQSAPHMPIDVKELDVDFLVFSGHKLYGPTGIGVIYGKRELLEKMEPFRVGGGMIREVSRDKATWAELPEKFEAGTPPVAEAVGLAAAINFVQNIGWDQIHKHEQELSQYAYDRLSAFSGLKIFTPIPDPVPALSGEERGGSGEFYFAASPILSFTLDGVHSHDLAQILGDEGVCIRAGHHCCQILHREVLQVAASARVSLGMYNTKADIDLLVKAVEIAKDKFRS